MPLLIVTHSVGDTNLALATARQYIADAKEEIHFLTVGQAAKTMWERLPVTDELKSSELVAVTHQVVSLHLR
jgi:hypothetical protein